MELTDTNRSRAWPSKVIGRMKENISCMQFWRYIAKTKDGPVAQLVRAPPCHGGGREFESLLGRLYGIIAQLGEHLPYKQRVIGSSPIGPIKLKKEYGWIPEWPKGTDCKSAASCFGGSNPPPSSAIWKQENILKMFIVKPRYNRGFCYLNNSWICCRPMIY